jgi:hypothetical protein
MTPRLPRSQIADSVAAAGSVAGDAGVLVGGRTVYPVSAADDTKGVIMHQDMAKTGAVIEICNMVSNKILKVYPPTSGTINGASANAAFSTASGKGVTLRCTAGGVGGTWASV